MPQVFVQPSFGKPWVRRYWAETLDRAVPFREPDRAGLLDPEDLTGLNAAHPSGRARFWGATAKHDRRMDTVTAGDVVLLTGRKRVLAVGEVGHGLRNPDFARHLWRPDPGRCVWSNVYSLRAFWPTDIPYEEVWALPGFNVGDNFMGLRFLRPDPAAAVLELTADVRVAAPG